VPKDKVIVHYGGGTPGPYTREGAIVRVRSYETYHMSPSRPGGPMRGLAYGWWVGQDGTVGVARGWNISGAQWSTDDLEDDGRPENDEGIAVLWVIGGEQAPTPQLLSGFERLRGYLEAVMGTGLPLYGHREVEPAIHPTACPGEPAMAYVRTHRASGQGPYPIRPVKWPALLRIGDQTRAVRALRGLLDTVGFRGPVGGTLFDQDLASRVLAFQSHAGLAADGVVGPATRAALAQAVGQALN